MYPPSVKNLFTALRSAVPDAAVGISLAHLAEDEAFSLYATELPSGRQLNAHYHQQGSEFYQVVSGQGIMLLSRQNGSQSRLDVRSGDIFVIPPMTIHQLINPGPDVLTMLFSCPPSHIGEDRHICPSLNPNP